jgi:GH15 family glucan-1,4-alpha-glucosidase
MLNLYQTSIDIILSNQNGSGAYIASPNFPTYHYCWFRDSAYIAYAMDVAGHHDSAARFHDWAARQINLRQEVVERAVRKVQAGEPLSGADYLYTRYTLDGNEEEDGEEAWPNFQLDGFGAWLWAVNAHLQMTGQTAPAEWLSAAGKATEYLNALWSQPCYDCWEEHPDKIHLHTLAAIYGGLLAYRSLSGVDLIQNLEAIRTYILNSAEANGYFVKYMGTPSVDASLLGLATPYRVVDPRHPYMVETARRIEHTLNQGGGVHRYATDTYYGGGEWVLLSGWLGWYYAETGHPDRARKLLQWMENQAGSDGSLPEQIHSCLIDPEHLAPWTKRWGPVATPLLWSHAMYIILKRLLD